MALSLNTQSAAASLKVRKDDFYETPAIAVHALLSAERFPTNIWEPACGRGAIAEPLRAAGHVVHSTDLVHRGYGTGGRDFLMELAAPEGFDCIVTNPPFKLASEFVAHSLHLCSRVAMLLRLAFLEGQKRSPVMDGGSLARVHVFRNRLPMMHRDGCAEQKEMSSALAFAWFVWDRKHNGPTELRRISWTKENVREIA